MELSEYYNTYFKNENAKENEAKIYYCVSVTEYPSEVKIGLYALREFVEEIDTDLRLKDLMKLGLAYRFISASPHEDGVKIRWSDTPDVILTKL